MISSILVKVLRDEVERMYDVYDALESTLFNDDVVSLDTLSDDELVNSEFVA